MQTITRHNNFFQGGSATSFLPKRKYAISLQTGSTSNQKYLTIPSPDLFTTGSCAIAFAFRYPTNTQVGPIKIGVPGTGFTIRLSSTGVFRISFGNASFDTTRNLADGKWHIIVILFDRGNDLTYFEDNWIQAGTQGNRISIDISTQTQDIEDGNDWLFGYNGVGYAHCEYDEIVFWSSSLSSIQAYVIYLSILNGYDIITGGGTIQSPTHYWKCNEGEGIRAKDDMGSDEDINMVNFGGGYDGWIRDGLS